MGEFKHIVTLKQNTNSMKKYREYLQQFSCKSNVRNIIFNTCFDIHEQVVFWTLSGEILEFTVNEKKRFYKRWYTGSSRKVHTVQSLTYCVP